MAASLLEIVDCGEGEFILKRAEDDSEPLVTINFSEEARGYMTDNGLDVAKAMIQAGFQAAAANSEPVEESEGAAATPRTLH